MIGSQNKTTPKGPRRKTLTMRRPAIFNRPYAPGGETAAFSGAVTKKSPETRTQASR